MDKGPPVGCELLPLLLGCVLGPTTSGCFYLRGSRYDAYVRRLFPAALKCRYFWLKYNHDQL